MLRAQTGKLLVYTSSSSQHENRFKPISIAAEKMAKVLKTDVEVKTLRKKFSPIYVYYKNGDEEPIPIYWSNKESNTQDVYDALRNMIFVLSFHPKNSALRELRKEIMQFS